METRPKPKDELMPPTCSWLRTKRKIKKQGALSDYGFCTSQLAHKRRYSSETEVDFAHSDCSVSYFSELEKCQSELSFSQILSTGVHFQKVLDIKSDDYMAIYIILWRCWAVSVTAWRCFLLSRRKTGSLCINWNYHKPVLNIKRT
jgi:predicted nucleic-acid-binding Zn-ribbon protein